MTIHAQRNEFNGVGDEIRGFFEKIGEWWDSIPKVDPQEQAFNQAVDDLSGEVEEIENAGLLDVADKQVRDSEEFQRFSNEGLSREEIEGLLDRAEDHSGTINTFGYGDLIGAAETVLADAGRFDQLAGSDGKLTVQELKDWAAAN